MMKSLIKSFVKFGLRYTVQNVARIVPKDEYLILFGAMHGLYFGDNSRHLFEWMIENRKDLHPIWLTRSKRVYCELNERNLPVAYIKATRAWARFLNN